MHQVIHFAQPYWLLAGLTLCFGIIFFWRGLRQDQQARMERFAAAHLLGRLTRNISPRRRQWKKGLWLLALFCCFLALARPQYGFKWVEVKRKGIDILFALDTSKSMLTEDVRPNRLERAKLAIMDFVGKLDGDRVGLLPFAGSAFLMCPLTIDYSAFEESLATINTSTIPRGGTDLARAITVAESSFPANDDHKILILLTDGENLEGDALAAATSAGKNGMTIFTVGVGTTAGELIPLPAGGPGNFVKDESGKFITSKLDEKTLAAIAEAARNGGIYTPLGKNGEGLDHIYQQKLSLIPKKELAEKRHKEPLERCSWPLGAAILLLMAEFIISGRRSERSLHIPFIKTAGRRGTKRTTAALLVLIALAGAHPAAASRGEKAFGAGDFLGAAKFYSEALKKNPDDPRLLYNAGTAAYKNNLYDDAIASFTKALKSDDLGLQEQTYYNLGNALYKKGEEVRQSDPQQAEKIWQQALDAYEGSLKLNPQAGDSKENRALVTSRLEELKKQQQQQNQQQDKKGGEKQEKEQGQQKEKPQTGDQQGQEGKQGQQEKQDDQSQKQPQDSAARNESPRQDKKSGDQAGSEEQAADKPKDQQQGQAEAEANNDKKQQEGAASPAQGQDEKRPQGSDTPKPLASENAPAKQAPSGRMTGEEARQLLRHLKDEEGRLNFVPREEKGRAGKEGTWKDW